MAKAEWRPGNMLYPLPVVMVSVADEEGHDNIITVAWAGTVCTNPPMVSISVRPERYSYKMLTDTREFVINLTTEKLAFATDYCGVKSGRDVDKFKELRLTREKASHVGLIWTRRGSLIWLRQILLYMLMENIMDLGKSWGLSDTALRRNGRRNSRERRGKQPWKSRM